MYLEKIDSSFANILNKDVLYLRFTSYTRYSFTQAATNTSFSNAITDKNRSIRSLVAVARNQPDLTNPAVNDKFITYQQNSILNYQLNVNGELTPPQAVDCTNGVEPYLHWLRYKDFWTSDKEFGGASVCSSVIGGTTASNTAGYNSTEFILAYVFDHHHNEPEDFVSGLDLGLNTNSVILNMTFTSTFPTVIQQIDIFVDRDMILRIDQNGKCRAFK